MVHRLSINMAIVGGNGIGRIFGSNGICAKGEAVKVTWSSFMSLSGQADPL